MKANHLATASLNALLALSLLAGCASTAHPTDRLPLGTPGSSHAMEAVIDVPGDVTVETVVGGEWEVPRSGLINLNNPVAKAAGLTDGTEPIKLFVHLVRHPTRGLYVVDTGVEHAFVADPSHAVISGMLGSLAHVDKLKVRRDTQTIVAQAGAPVEGLFLTHFHLDHVLGTRDLPAAVPIYVGAGDPEDRSFMNLFERGVYDTALEGKGPLHEIHFDPDSDGIFEGVRDVFGDGSFWAIWVPGHTPGSVAFLARTPKGPVLLTGDACHSAWGWEHGVEPGTFSDDLPRSADSLARLERLVTRHPTIEVRLGHQSLPANEAK